MIRARDSLRGRWGMAIGGTVLYVVVAYAVGVVPIIGFIVSILITGAMSIGLARFALSLARKTGPKVSDVFTGFDKFAIGLGAYLLQMVFIVLWSLLLIVPGVIAALSYAMTYYIIAEEASVGPLEAIAKSKTMMRGHKWQLFCLGFRFVGWALLCVLSLGVGFLWLFPYMIVSMAHFYDDISTASTKGEPVLAP
jgi:uncharacterized membrane protein